MYAFLNQVENSCLCVHDFYRYISGGRGSEICYQNLWTQWQQFTFWFWISECFVEALYRRYPTTRRCARSAYET